MKKLLYPQKESARAFCGHCRQERAVSRRVVAHRFHAILTVGTLGAWAPVWVAVWLGGRGIPWRCKMCRRSISIAHTPVSPKTPIATRAI